MSADQTRLFSGLTTPAAGLVRKARRPLGWIAPGPQPAGDRGDPRLLPGPGEDLCHLSGDFRIFQRPGGHRWSVDDLVTAWMAAELYNLRRGGAPASFLDLGCGIGSILMLVAWRFEQARGLGLEAQSASVELARRSLDWNGLDDRIEVFEGDLRQVRTLIGPRSFDLITGSPPYFAEGRASVSLDDQRHRCRHETRGGIEIYCEAASVALAPGGLFVVCMPAAAHERVQQAAEVAGLCVVASRTVVPRAGKAPLFTVHAAVRAGEDLVLDGLTSHTVGGLATDGSASHSAGGLATDGSASQPGLSEAVVARSVQTDAVVVSHLPGSIPLVVRDATGQWTDEFRSLRNRMGLPG